jgi:hypothetical protein
MTPNLQEIHDVLLFIATRAGEMILAANPSSSNANIKKNSAHLNLLCFLMTDQE